MSTIQNLSEELIFINDHRGMSTGIVVERDLRVLSLKIEIEKLRELAEIKLHLIGMVTVLRGGMEK